MLYAQNVFLAAGLLAILAAAAWAVRGWLKEQYNRGYDKGWDVGHSVGSSASYFNGIKEGYQSGQRSVWRLAELSGVASRSDSGNYSFKNRQQIAEEYIADELVAAFIAFQSNITSERPVGVADFPADDDDDEDARQTV